MFLLFRIWESKCKRTFVKDESLESSFIRRKKWHFHSTIFVTRSTDSRQFYSSSKNQSLPALNMRAIFNSQMYWGVDYGGQGSICKKLLCAAFSYESVLNSFFVRTVCVCNFLAEGNWQKNCSSNVNLPFAPFVWWNCICPKEEIKCANKMTLFCLQY